MHASYVEAPTEQWLVAHGGRCYKESDTRQGFIEMVKCPTCERWLKDEVAYQQHWNSCHT